MGGFSFLVSPQTDEAARATQTQVQSAFDQQATADRQGAQLQTQSDIAEERTKAAEARQDAATQRMYTMQANSEAAAMGRTEAMTAKQFSLAQVLNIRQRYNDLASTVKKTIDTLQGPANARFNQAHVAAYVPAAQQALAQSGNIVEQGISDFLKNGKTGDAPNIDFTQLPITQLQGSEANPLILQGFAAKNAESQERASAILSNAAIAKKRLEDSEGKLSSADQGVWNDYHRSLAQADYAQSTLDDYVKTVRNPDLLRLAALQQNVTKSKYAFVGASAAFHANAKIGKFGAHIQSETLKPLQSFDDVPTSTSQFLTSPDQSSTGGDDTSQPASDGSGAMPSFGDKTWQETGMAGAQTWKGNQQ